MIDEIDRVRTRHYGLAEVKSFLKVEWAPWDR